MGNESKINSKVNCKICGSKSDFIFDATILNKNPVKYYYCSNCGFLQTEDPYWLEEAYKNPINLSDTGYLQRNFSLSKKLLIPLYLFFNKDAKFLDYAGGYGVFVRLMRDIGFDFYWQDKYTQNLFARGFEYNGKDKIEAITTFESFEHFANPIEEVEKMLGISNNIIFTTELLPALVPKPNDWWYYGLEHGQHISFYSENTLRFIAQKYNLNYYNFKGLYFIIKKKLPGYAKFYSKLKIFGFDKFIRKRLISKTWEDHLKLRNVK